MNAQTKHCVLFAGVVFAMITLGSLQRTAGAVVVMEQDRSVWAFIIVPPCEAKIIDSDMAEDFDPFDAVAESSASCEAALGFARAEQQSTISDTVFEAQGSTLSQADAASLTVLHAISNSDYTVTFEVTRLSQYELSGSLAVAGGLPVVLTHAMARLTASTGEVIFEQTIVPGPDGRPNGQVLELAGLLEPGQYTFIASGSTVIDSEVPPFGNGAAFFDATLGIAVFGDLDGDGAVGVGDLLILFGEWGLCEDPDNCPADLDGDGVAGISDLLILLRNWG